MGPRWVSVRAAVAVAAIAVIQGACASGGNADNGGSFGDDGSTASPVDGLVEGATDSAQGTHDSSTPQGNDTGSSGMDAALEASGGGDSATGGPDTAAIEAGVDSSTEAAADGSSVEAGNDAALDSGVPETGVVDGGSCTTSSQCNAPPSPLACYPAQGTCTGGTCFYDTNPGSAVCGSTCCNPIRRDLQRQLHAQLRRRVRTLHRGSFARLRDGHREQHVQLRRVRAVVLRRQREHAVVHRRRV